MTASCENCGRAHSSPALCEHCGAIFPVPDEGDDFAFLGLPATYAVDPAAVEARHLALTRFLHPDRTAGRTPLERELAVRHQARANRAAARLKHPYERALLLLRRSADPAVLEDRATPPGFLEEMLALREELEAPAGEVAGDAPRARLRAECARRFAALQSEIAAHFAALERDAGGARPQPADFAPPTPARGCAHPPPKGGGGSSQTHPRSTLDPRRADLARRLRLCLNAYKYLEHLLAE